VQASESTSVHRPIVYLDYDNLDEVTRLRRYDGDGVSVTVTGGVPDAPSASLLRAQAEASYDEQGRAYQTRLFGVDPATGAVSSSALTDNTWFDHRGNAVKESAPGGLAAKARFDGAGRLVTAYTSDGGGDAGWADALTVTGDAVLERADYQYDASGNLLLTA